MKIALLCPYRERKEKTNALIKSIINTAENINNIVLYFGIDDDDSTIEYAQKVAETYSFIKIIPIHNNGTFLGLGKIWNIMAKEVKEDIFAMIGQDMVFETKNWDSQIIEEAKKFSDGIYMIHCNDGMRGPGNKYSSQPPLAVNSFIGRKYYDLLGHYTREEWKHGFHDTWLHDVFESLQRRVYRHDILIKHLHHSEVGGTDKISQNLESQWTDSKNKNEFYYITMKSEREREINILRDEIQKGYPKLSILICSLHRRKDFFDRLVNILKPQITKDVEVLASIDDGQLSIGAKRNELLNAAKGAYIAFVDDDDRVSEDYVALILNAIEAKPDVVGMHLIMNTDGKLSGKTYHSLKYDRWYDVGVEDKDWRYYYRNPNHLNPVKRELALKVGFENISNGEDRIYSGRLLPLLKKEVMIESPIYFYEVRTNKLV